MTFFGVMTDSAFDLLGAFGPADADPAGSGTQSSVDSNAALPYSASRPDVLYTDTAPGGAAITIGLSVGDATQASAFGDLLRAIGVSEAAAAFGDGADARDGVLGYTLATAANWSVGVMDSSAGFETLVPGADPGHGSSFDRSPGDASTLWQSFAGSTIVAPKGNDKVPCQLPPMGRFTNAPND